VPHLAVRGEVDENLGEAAIAAIVLGVLAGCIVLACLLLQLSRKSRLVFLLFELLSSLSYMLIPNQIKRKKIISLKLNF
jgi:hypothetical protein